MLYTDLLVFEYKYDLWKCFIVEELNVEVLKHFHQSSLSLLFALIPAVSLLFALARASTTFLSQSFVSCSVCVPPRSPSSSLCTTPQAKQYAETLVWLSKPSLQY